MQAVGQLHRQGHIALGVCQAEVKAVLVQVVGIGDVPVDAQAVIVQNLQFQLVGFLNGQEFRLCGPGAKRRWRCAAGNLGRCRPVATSNKLASNARM